MEEQARKGGFWDETGWKVLSEVSSFVFRYLKRSWGRQHGCFAVSLSRQLLRARLLPPIHQEADGMGAWGSQLEQWQPRGNGDMMK